MEHSGCLLQGRRLREGPERWKKLGVKFAESALGSTSVSSTTPMVSGECGRKETCGKGGV